MNANFHTHTALCDGSCSPEEMVQAAIARGMTALGFSGHSHLSFDPHTMSEEGTREYLREVKRLKSAYADKIDIYLGLEQEIFSEPPPEELDFIIGAVHFVVHNGEYVCVDNGARAQQEAVNQHFGGDYYAMAEAYFETMAQMSKTAPDIIAHFDLVTKYNVGGSLFDESHPRYITAAVTAMDEILKYCNLFEVNTGAMYRLNRPEPYPSTRLLRELHKRGGEVILSSDSHEGESLCYKFDDMRKLLRTCGFEHSKTLTRDGFVTINN